ncbi:M23 family metallopeptidase [Paraliomyxa miuraensis]|uniref:M23 family metallopeptidase n=1 Tax=Paraliomyxa miuraensis TaxID=376150 RepID=UPI00224F943F|nr:M23 family metallopeptidase [Paraliomyxa miuraensis]MCX4244775.1 M23 family metallopeptidase [Paraliomyxa miuraensis]
MRIVVRVGASWGLGLLLSLAGCSGDGESSQAWDPGTSGGDGSSAAGDDADTAPEDDDEGGTTGGADDGSTTTGEEPPQEQDWCLYVVLPSADDSLLNVYAEPDPTSEIQYSIIAGETLWGAPTVIDGYRDLDRWHDMPQWAEIGRLENTGVCEDEDETPPEEEEVQIPEGLQLPFVCGDAWRLDTWGHAPALDMVREPDQHGTEGAPLLAPGPGIVNQSFFHANAGNLVQIDHGGGYFTTYVHMQSRAVEVGDVVELGDGIGAVGKTGPTSNNHPHLHFELGFDANGDGEASWGFSGAERILPWFDGVEYGQSNSQTWRDVVSGNCP